MMMVYGLFVFSLNTAAYQDLQRQTRWRHASTSRIGQRPARQFLGPGDDQIRLSGTLLPQFTGGQQNLDDLRDMANDGKGWPLIEGSGINYGVYVITSMSEAKSNFFKDGAAQKIDFNLSLQRIDEARSDLIGQLSSTMLRAALRAT